MGRTPKNHYKIKKLAYISIGLFFYKNDKGVIQDPGCSLVDYLEHELEFLKLWWGHLVAIPKNLNDFVEPNEWRMGYHWLRKLGTGHTFAKKIGIGAKTNMVG